MLLNMYEKLRKIIQFNSDFHIKGNDDHFMQYL